MKQKPSHTPGHKAVLVSDEAFLILKSFQRHEAGDRIALSFDLKDIVTAIVIEATETIPDLRERTRLRALTVMHDIVATQYHHQE